MKKRQIIILLWTLLVLPLGLLLPSFIHDRQYNLITSVRVPMDYQNYVLKRFPLEPQKQLSALVWKEMSDYLMTKDI
ncbi:MAG: hypothetical protein PQJ50_04080, partial [Spirochaetales bacterium]|nr:hypothetical protein [Spirochaetales bacterium]